MTDYKSKYQKGLGLYQSPYDAKAWHFDHAIPLGSLQLPEQYETTDAPFTYDQGDSNMCCASAYCYIRYLQESDHSQSGLTEKFAPLFNYVNRCPGEDFEGMYLSSCMKKGREGSVLWSELPYFCSLYEGKQLLKARKAELMKKAQPFSISSYYICNSTAEIKTAIMTTKAVLIGIPVFDCFYEPDENGVIHYDKCNPSKSDGGHAIAVRGWRIIDGKLHWLIKNSWGEEWGNLGNGSAYLPDDYPWLDSAYVAVDQITESKFVDYKEKYYLANPEQTNWKPKKQNIFQKIYNKLHNLLHAFRKDRNC